jgi:hypothetical protein
MLSVFSLFRRPQTAAIGSTAKTPSQPVKLPQPLATEDFKHVAGGLPNGTW